MKVERPLTALAKFLIKQLLAVFKQMSKEDWDDKELRDLQDKLFGRMQ